MAWSGWIFVGLLVGGFMFVMQQTPKPKTLSIKDKRSFLENLAKVFVEPTEKYKASLGGYYVIDYVENNVLSEAFALVSDKRVYFNGESYTRKDGKLKKSLEDRTVDLKDITGTGFTKENPRYTLVTFIIFSILAFVSFVVTLTMKEPSLAIDLLPLVTLTCALVAYVFYKKKKISLFEIAFTDGKIGFNTGKYFESEINHFQEELQLAKENAVNNQDDAKVGDTE